MVVSNNLLLCFTLTSVMVPCWW